MMPNYYSVLRAMNERYVIEQRVNNGRVQQLVYSFIGRLRISHINKSNYTEDDFKRYLCHQLREVFGFNGDYHVNVVVDPDPHVPDVIAFVHLFDNSLHLELLRHLEQQRYRGKLLNVVKIN